MISKELMERFKEFEPQVNTATSIKVKVDVSPSYLVEKLAEVTLSELYRMSNTAMATKLDQLEEGSILRYYKTLIFLRTAKANDELRGELGKWRAFYKYASVPSFLYQILVSIGICRDEDFNLVFTPSYSIDAEDFLALEEAIVISDLLRGFIHLSQVAGLPNDRVGELAFMAMQHVEGRVTSYRKDHPVYGFLASFIEQQQFNNITGTMHRIIYGATADYEMLMTALMTKFLDRRE